MTINTDAMGRFIYGAARFGGKLQDVKDWMADDMGLPRLASGDDDAARALYSEFFEKYSNNEALKENHDCFMNVLKSRPRKTD